MNWYPWLNLPYKQIITFYQKRKHHALLLHSNPGMASDVLVCAITKWLICLNPINIKNCGSCHNCQLMLTHNHPDLHKIINENNSNKISIENIRSLTENLVNYAQQGGAKVIWFPNVALLTESAITALLKTLEEPTNNTYFLLECRDPIHLLTTLRSRCFYYYLSAPDPQTIINWLKKQNINLTLLEIETAIKLNLYAPLATLNLLKPKNWLKRKNFCKSLMQSLVNKNFLILLIELDQSNVLERIYWLISFLLDALKHKLDATSYCINQDELPLIKKLANINSSDILLKSITRWMTCRYQLISITGLNQKLHLSAQLIKWQNTLYLDK
ncbi:DNA polymerase III subunit delta' [Candidatus Arsenophonus lipoptenae]|uniref:DNA polymerase III subunit delta' n=1 Tax=Candidatus Arsenophonus lipoptenae TaxID=634113 RepID=A0A0X9VLV5_9GAMM|nr:DNA polymerase III subunit delta' C-terminal domain-containing protein [Candidatus Arsenophonus lipoptenae]AMA64671.1 DNA polymerase III subunit delta' [Candidatus Arsenophonus lipoptenae]